MKFLVTGDWHADWQTAGIRRFEDVRNAALQLTDIAKAQEVDRFVFLGDLCEPETALWANSLAIEVTRRFPYADRTIWLVGNHDVVEDGYGTHALLPLAATNMSSVYDRPTVRRFENTKASKETVAALKPGECSGELWLAAFPYTSTAQTYDPAEFVNEIAEKVPEYARLLVISHLMLEDIAPGSETTDMARGRDIFLPREHLQTAFRDRVTICNGHYHSAQTYKGVHIPGSLVRLTQSEIGNAPGYLIVEIPT